MMKGQLWISNDINFIINGVNNGYKIIVLNEVTEQFKLSTKCLEAKVLLPPYQTMAFYADGDMNNYFQSYTSYLTTADPMKFICAMLKALYIGVNLIIYMNNDELQMYANTICGLFSNMFGIFIGITGSNNFSYNPNANQVATTLGLLYIDNLISLDEFLTSYPREVDFAPFTLEPIAHELNLDLRLFQTQGQLKDYIYGAINKNSKLPAIIIGRK